MRQRRLGEQERAADVDVHHQVELLGREVLGRFGGDRTGVVDHDVDAAEALDGGVDGTHDVVFVADVPDNGDPLTPGRLDLGDRGVHCAGQLGMGFGGLGQQHDVGAVPGGAQRDGEPDAPAASRDHHGAIGERCVRR